MKAHSFPATEAQKIVLVQEAAVPAFFQDHEQKPQQHHWAPLNKSLEE